MTKSLLPEKRSARERACVACAAAVVSAKWNPQLIYALANGVQRFSELQKTIGLNPRTLSVRLDDLEAAGIVSKAASAEAPLRIDYSLTQKGRDLLPILEQMVAWGNKYAARELA